MTFLEAQQYIASFINFEQRPPGRNLPEFKLERMRYLLKLLGDPQNDLKIIHVAGSKGKGSTCALTASVLRAAGYRTGLYTSPHLNNYRERIRVLDHAISSAANAEDIFPDMIPEPELCAVLEALQPHIARVQGEKTWGEVSFFELFTAAAFYYFRRENVDWVVLETGMGGRLDATNVAPSRICVITPISLEHTRYLGDSIEKIAVEKAAIIKDLCQKVVIAPQHPDVRKVLEQRCAEFGLCPGWVGHDIRYEILQEELFGQRIAIKGTRQQYADLKLSLIGPHQAVNAAVVFGIIEAVNETGAAVSPGAVCAGLNEAFWPGRLEIVGENPLIILDGAHNRASAMNLVEGLQRLFPEKTVTLVVGVSEDKDRAGICREIDRIAGKIIATKACHPRAYGFSREELKTFFPGKPCILTEDLGQAIASARQGTDKDIILITGSIFLVGEARRYLLNKKYVSTS